MDLYYLLNDMVPKIVKNLQNSEGGPLSTIRRVALYSCGDSDNKLFCDGTHAITGFASKNKGAENSGSGEEKRNNNNNTINEEEKENSIFLTLTIYSIYQKL